MNRVKENKEMREYFAKSAKETPAGSFNQMVSWYLGTMTSFLGDISNSLAVIADNMTSKKDDKELKADEKET